MMEGPFVGDVGHIGRWPARVAQYVNPPATANGFREDALALQIACAWGTYLLEAERAVALFGYDTYGHRQREAREGRPGLYVNFHVNSFDPPGDYALILGGGPGWDDIADTIAVHLAEATELQVRVEEAGKRGFGGEALVSTIARAGCPALIIEPGFINNLDHARLWQAGGPGRIGRAVAQGCLEA